MLTIKIEELLKNKNEHIQDFIKENCIVSEPYRLFLMSSEETPDPEQLEKTMAPTPLLIKDKKGNVSIYIEKKSGLIPLDMKNIEQFKNLPFPNELNKQITHGKISFHILEAIRIQTKDAFTFERNMKERIRNIGNDLPRGLQLFDAEGNQISDGMEIKVDGIEISIDKNPDEFYTSICSKLPQGVGAILFQHYSQAPTYVLNAALMGNIANLSKLLERNIKNKLYCKDGTLYFHQSIENIRCMDFEKQAIFHINGNTEILFELTEEGFLFKQLTFTNDGIILKSLFDGNIGLLLQDMEKKQEKHIAGENYREYLNSVLNKTKSEKNRDTIDGLLTQLAPFLAEIDKRETKNPKEGFKIYSGETWEQYDCDKILKNAEKITEQLSTNDYLTQAVIYHSLKKLQLSLEKTKGKTEALKKTVNTWLKKMSDGEIIDIYSLKEKDTFIQLLTTANLSRQQVRAILEILPPLDEQKKKEKALWELEVKKAKKTYDQDSSLVKKFKDACEHHIKAILAESENNNPNAVLLHLMHLGALIHQHYPHIDKDKLDKKTFLKNSLSALLPPIDTELLTLPHTVGNAMLFLQGTKSNENIPTPAMSELIQHGLSGLHSMLGVNIESIPKSTENELMDPKKSIEKTLEKSSEIQEIINPVIQAKNLYRCISNEALANIENYAENTNKNSIKDGVKKIKKARDLFFLSGDLRPFLADCTEAFNLFQLANEDALVWQRLQAQLLLGIDAFIKEAPKKEIFDEELLEEELSEKELAEKEKNQPDFISRLEKQEKFPILREMEKKYNDQREPLIKAIKTELSFLNARISVVEKAKENPINPIRLDYFKEYRQELIRLLKIAGSALLEQPNNPQECIDLVNTFESLKKIHEPKNIEDHAKYEDHRRTLLKTISEFENKKLASNIKTDKFKTKVNDSEISSETTPLCLPTFSSQESVNTIWSVAREQLEKNPIKATDTLQENINAIWEVGQQLEKNYPPTEAKKIMPHFSVFHPKLSMLELGERNTPVSSPSTLSRVRKWSGWISIVGLGATIPSIGLGTLFTAAFWAHPEMAAMFATIASIVIVATLACTIGGFITWSIAKAMSPKSTEEILEADLQNEQLNDENFLLENKKILDYLTKLSASSELYIDIKDESVIYKDITSVNMHYFNPKGTVPPKYITDKNPEIVITNSTNLAKDFPENVNAWLIYIYENKKIPKNIDLNMFNIRAEVINLIQQPNTKNNVNLSNKEIIIELQKDNLSNENIIIDIKGLDKFRQEERTKTISLSQSNDILFAAKNEKKVLPSKISEEIIIEMPSKKNNL